MSVCSILPKLQMSFPRGRQPQSSIQCLYPAPSLGSGHGQPAVWGLDVVLRGAVPSKRIHKLAASSHPMYNSTLEQYNIVGTPVQKKGKWKRLQPLVGCCHQILVGRNSKESQGVEQIPWMKVLSPGLFPTLFTLFCGHI